MLGRLLKWSAIASLTTLALGLGAYARDMVRAYRRVQARGTAIPSPYGAIQYTEGGSGPDVLVIHGAGGGYDQGELIAQAILGDGFRWITPSRFGYLGSDLPEGATWDDQARAYAYLLGYLGVEKAAVVAMSQGGPSALLFAALYPERVSSLALVSCGVAPSSTEVRAEADQKGAMLKAIFRFDLLYWAVSKLFRQQFLGLMGAGPDVRAGLTPEEQRGVARIVEYMNPASLRSAGAAFDNETALPGARIAAIEAPVLIFHAKDDTLQLYHNALFAASTIPGARLMCFDEGGHLLIAVEQETIRAALQEHIVSHLKSHPLFPRPLPGAAHPQVRGDGRPPAGPGRGAGGTGSRVADQRPAGHSAIGGKQR
jgi:2-hydroxy-6-oxonona-2,4-dienedioate hydrolase